MNSRNRRAESDKFDPEQRMYTPKSFQVSDQGRLFNFIEQHSFGIVFTAGSPDPVASHLPLLVDRKSGTHGRLIGHMARANRQWKDADGQNACIVFPGPHTYISPTWYNAEDVVPTWNYVAVHVYGAFRIVTDRSRVIETLRETVAIHEAHMQVPWRIDNLKAGLVEKLLEAIVAFEVDIARIEGKWKLSQNHDPERRRNVIARLQELSGDEPQRIARLMLEELPTKDSTPDAGT